MYINITFNLIILYIYQEISEGKTLVLHRSRQLSKFVVLGGIEESPGRVSV